MRADLPRITLASNVYLMPGNAAWQPWLPQGDLLFMPQGQWLRPADSDVHIVLWIWELLLTQETRLAWQGLTEPELVSAMDVWLTGLLAPLAAQSNQGPLYVGAMALNAGSVSGYQPHWLPLLEWRLSQRLRALRLQDLALPLWLSQQGRALCLDERNRYLFSCPFSMAGLQGLANWLLQRWLQDSAPRRKVLVLDCDNTLWGGVLAEDGLARLTLGQDGLGKLFQAFQQAASDWYQRGVLLALCSKNHPQDVWQVFAQHSGMRLMRSQIAAESIGWTDKSSGLQQIARDLNLGLDALVFWDDSPLERAEVRARCPEVEVVEPPVDIWQWPVALQNLGCFSMALTREDLLRQDSYQALAQVERLKLNSSSKADYLTALGLRATMYPLSEDLVSRAEQLTQKTNQFNLSCRRYTANELAAWPADGWRYLVALQDNYADHGLVGLVLVLRLDDVTAFVDTLTLSCRVLGRGLENWLLQQLAQRLQTVGVRQLILGASICPRNEPALTWLAALPVSACANPDPGRFPHECCYRLALADLQLPYVEYYNHD